MELGVFINLAQDSETDGRISTLKVNLPGVKVDPAMYGAGQFGQYPTLAQQLVAACPNADAFFAPCWPSLQALCAATQKPIVFGGVVTATA
jgi:hypothetical protein